MAQHGQVRTVCAEVLLRSGQISVSKVRARLKELGLPQGKTADLLATINEYKRELAELRAAGDKKLNALAIQFAIDAKRFNAQVNEFLKNAVKFSDSLMNVWAANRLLQRDLPAERAVLRRRRQRVQKTIGSPKSELLKREVERILDPARKGTPQVVTPLLANHLFRMLRPEIAKLFDLHHFSRALRFAANTSTRLYRLPDRRWWRHDRLLPRGNDVAGKIAKRYVSRGTPLSQVRSGNQRQLQQALSVLIKSRTHLGWRAVAEELGIPNEQHAKFKQMLRNHIRNRRPRFYQDSDGLYYVSKQTAI